MEDCIFCKIVAGQIPSTKLYEDQIVYAFRDIHPQAPTHILVVPKKHYTYLSEMGEKEKPLMGHMLLVANKLAKDEGVAKSGYRVVVNCGQEGGQIVPHVHLHLLAGRQLTGEMG